MELTAINPWRWQEKYGYAQAYVISGRRDLLICSGQTANDENGVPLKAGEMPGQIMLAFANLKAILDEAGWQVADIVQIRIFTTDVDLFMQHGDVLSTCLNKAGCTPAQTLLGVSRLAFPEMLVEIEALAMREPASGDKDGVGA